MTARYDNQTRSTTRHIIRGNSPWASQDIGPARNRSHAQPCPSQESKQRGQAATEYILVLVFGVLVLFIPIPIPSGAGGDVVYYRPVALLMLDVFEIYLESFHTMIGLPIP